MHDEFELTYLIKELPLGVKDSPHKEILDIYIPAHAEHTILRIRKSGDTYEITKKQPAHGIDSSHQIENTIPLSREEFADLSVMTGKRIEKTRYYYQENSVTYEVDVFKGDLAGLVVVDVEFKSNEQKDRFVPPTWVLADVAQAKFIAGGVLCGKKYIDIQVYLKNITINLFLSRQFLRDCYNNLTMKNTATITTWSSDICSLSLICTKR